MLKLKKHLNFQISSNSEKPMENGRKERSQVVKINWLYCSYEGAKTWNMEENIIWPKTIDASPLKLLSSSNLQILDHCQNYEQEIHGPLWMVHRSKWVQYHQLIHNTHLLHPFLDLAIVGSSVVLLRNWLSSNIRGQYILSHASCACSHAIEMDNIKQRSLMQKR